MNVLKILRNGAVVCWLIIIFIFLGRNRSTHHVDDFNLRYIFAIIAVGLAVAILQMVLYISKNK